MNPLSSKLFLILCFTAFIFNTSLTQQKENTVAEINGEKITASEFLLRYELSPFITHKSGGDKEYLKSDFLYSMVAEKLWYFEALNNGLSESEQFRFYFKPLEDIHLREALFKLEIEDKVRLSPDEITNGIKNAGYTLNCIVVSSQDSARIFELHKNLKNTLSDKHDSLLQSKRYSNCAAHPYKIEFGTLKDAEVEDFLFTLTPGESSLPMRSEFGWTLFLIKEKQSKLVDLTDAKVIAKIKKTIKDRMVLLKTEEYFQKLLAPHRININEDTFKQMSESIYTAILRGFPTTTDTSKVKYILSDNDFKEIKSSLGKVQLDKPLFSINELKVSVWDFLAQLAFEEHTFSSNIKVNVYQKLITLIKAFVQQQILTKEARRQGLLNLESIKNDLKLWKENMLAQMLKISYLDSSHVTNDEVLDYYKNDFAEDKDIIYINLQILTLSRLTDIEDALRMMSSGKSFDEILKSYGKTDPLVNDSGYTGIQPAVTLGNIGSIAVNLDLNQLYGPIKRGEGYSLIMLKERNQKIDAILIDYNTSKELLRNYLSQKKLNKIISDETVKLSSKYGARIYPDAVHTIKTTDVYMFTHRLMGFGGRISAVPLLDNWADWIDIKKFKEVLLP